MSEHTYEFEFPVNFFLRGLSILSHLLRKAEAHAREHQIEPSALLAARLFPDMFPLKRQVQTVCDTAKRSIGRFANVEPPTFKDDEVDFGALRARIDKTVEFIQAHGQAALHGAITRIIKFNMPQGPITLPGSQYLARFALPNFYFHLTTAYNIMRHNGVPLGKVDYLGDFVSTQTNAEVIH